MSQLLLPMLLLAPLLGIVVVWLLPARLSRWACLGAMLLALFLAVVVLFAYDPAGSRFQLLASRPWLPGIGVNWTVAVDGLAVLFLPATALLFLGVLVAFWQDAGANPRRCFSSVLLLLFAMLGVFSAVDLILFFVFWELTLLPIYFLLVGRGVVADAPGVAARYVLIMLAGGIPLLIAFVMLAGAHPVPVFDLPALLARPADPAIQRVAFVLMLIGFALKVPLVPLHTWLPQFALAAPGSLTAVLVGLKIGAFGLLRFAIPLAPQAAQEMHWLLAGLGTLTLLYGAVGILSHSNLRVSLAYASICHVGLAVLGLATLTAQGVQGTVSLLLSFSVATGGGMLLLEFLRQRTGSTDIHALGGVAQSMPLLATGVLICGLAGVGMPGTSSFPGEFILILAALDRYTGAGMAALFGLSIAAGAFLARYRTAFWGPATRPAVLAASDLRPREWAVLIALIAMIVGIGIYPSPWIDLLRPAAEAWAAGILS